MKDLLYTVLLGGDDGNKRDECQANSILTIMGIVYALFVIAEGLHEVGFWHWLRTLV